MNFALVGNGACQALIDPAATLVWLCWPRPDSSFVFGQLLDPNAGAFSIRPTALEEHRQAYETDSNVLRTRLTAADGIVDVVDFAPIGPAGSRPHALVRILEPVEGAMELTVTCTPTAGYGTVRPDASTEAGQTRWALGDHTLNLSHHGAPLDVPFRLTRPIQLVLWLDEPASPLADARTALEHTRGYWTDFVSTLTLPERYREPVVRSALALALHQYVPTGAITAATTTSLPEAPGAGRNWDYRYCWLRDAWYTVSALQALGSGSETNALERWVDRIAHERPDRLQPMYTVAGEPRMDERELPHLRGFDGEGPVRIGNAAYLQEQHDVYGELILAFAENPERATTRTHALAAYLLEQIADTLEAPDVGLWEKRDAPHVHTFTLLMHWAGARAVERAAVVWEDDALQDRAADLREAAAELIEGAWREDAGGYADALDSDHADAALLLMVSLGYLDDEPERAHSHVDWIARELTAGPSLLHRYLHDDGLGDTHATFTVCGLWYAEALARLGRVDQAESVFQTILSHANPVGLLSEDIDPRSGSLWGNFPQTYSHAGVVHAALAIEQARHEASD